MNISNRVVLIHGNCGASVANIWFPWVRKQFINSGIQVVAKNFPDAIKGRLRYWLPYLKEEIRPDADTILVGHSSGGLVSLKYAEQNQLLGTVLVATQMTDCGYKIEQKSGFFDEPFLWDRIRKNQAWIIQFHSTDDPWVPVSEARQIHKLLKTEYYEMTKHGHFGNAQQDMRIFPELVEVIKKKLQRRVM